MWGTCTTVLYQRHFQWASAIFSWFAILAAFRIFAAAHIKDKISLHSMSACLSVCVVWCGGWGGVRLCVNCITLMIDDRVEECKENG